MSEDKRLFDFSTWEFVKNIRKSNVVNLTWFAPFGLIMYGLTSLFYILMATSFTEDRFHDLSWSIFGIHVFVVLLVLLDSVRCFEIRFTEAKFSLIFDSDKNNVFK